MKLKKIDLFAIHSLLINPLLNGMAFFYTDVFYENHTHIGNTLHHPIYFFLWSVSTVFGYYYYSKKIWDTYSIQYKKKLHLITHILMLGSILIPYSKDLPFWINDGHVWLAILCVTIYYGEWIYLGFRTILSVQKELKFYYLILVFSLFVLVLFGHVTSISEMTLSTLSSIYLWYWWKKTAK